MQIPCVSCLQRESCSFVLAPLWCPDAPSITTREGGIGGPYSGVRSDAYYIANPGAADDPGSQILDVADMPISFLADTVCLPFDLLSGNKP
jgi:uncharacterized protein YceK